MKVRISRHIGRQHQFNTAQSNLCNGSWRPLGEDLCGPGGVRIPSAVRVLFPELCRHGCKCRSPDEASEWFQEHFQGEHNHPLTGENGLIQPPEPSGSTISSGGTSSGAGNLIGSVQQTKNNFESENKCAAKVHLPRTVVQPQEGKTLAHAASIR